MQKLSFLYVVPLASGNYRKPAKAAVVYRKQPKVVLYVNKQLLSASVTGEPERRAASRQKATQNVRIHVV